MLLNLVEKEDIVSSILPEVETPLETKSCCRLFNFNAFQPPEIKIPTFEFIVLCFLYSSQRHIGNSRSQLILDVNNRMR